jgi:hypothetical protein
MRLRHPLVALALALVLVSSSVTLAVARGEGALAGWMELCAGGTSVTVAMDAEGNPISLHPCPDCLTGLSGPLPAPAATPARPLTAALILQPARAQPAVTRRSPAPPARGPPLSL